MRRHLFVRRATVRRERNHQASVVRRHPALLPALIVQTLLNPYLLTLLNQSIIMLQAILIGNVGANAEYQEKDGRKFTTFRVAHNDRWTDQAGQTHNNTVWVDCIMNDHPNVAQYLKQGTQVAIIGNVSLRVYSSQKDRCMKAGITINVRNVELLGGQTDPVPTRLYDQQGLQHDVTKFYHTNVASTQLMSQRGEQFAVDENGWVSPVKQQQDSQQQQQTAQAGTQQQQKSDNPNSEYNGENAPAF